ncbi:hypothetical protein BY996DRAFT_6511028 [Phakopsora pachyrhizi]|nr:hypothetical protein BY996DRAFT_6511028 [Phakopsora pachyrhizi]
MVDERRRVSARTSNWRIQSAWNKTSKLGLKQLLALRIWLMEEDEKEPTHWINKVGNMIGTLKGSRDGFIGHCDELVDEDLERGAGLLAVTNDLSYNWICKLISYLHELPTYQNWQRQDIKDEMTPKDQSDPPSTRNGELLLSRRLRLEAVESRLKAQSTRGTKNRTLNKALNQQKSDQDRRKGQKEELANEYGIGGFGGDWRNLVLSTEQVNNWNYQWRVGVWPKMDKRTEEQRIQDKEDIGLQEKEAEKGSRTEEQRIVDLKINNNNNNKKKINKRKDSKNNKKKKKKKNNKK